MFTLTDFETAREELNSTREGQVYSPEKNAVSYELSQIQSPHDRGTMVEIMVANRLKLSGVDCKQVGGRGQVDIEIYVNGRIVRGEVKSASLGPKSRRYEFTGIDPEKLDILFLVFVHPTRGLVVRTVSKNHVVDCVRNLKWSQPKEGYTIGFNEDMVNNKVITSEWHGGAWS